MEFANIRMDIDRYELLRDGERLSVEPLIFDLITLFAQHPERVFTKDDLMAEIWPGKIVSDATITGAIKSARKALGDSSRKQTLIKTVHGRVSRFNGAPTAARLSKHDIKGAGRALSEAFRIRPDISDGEINRLLGPELCSQLLHLRQNAGQANTLT